MGAIQDNGVQSSVAASTPIGGGTPVLGGIATGAPGPNSDLSKHVLLPVAAGGRNGNARAKIGIATIPVAGITGSD